MKKIKNTNEKKDIKEFLMESLSVYVIVFVVLLGVGIIYITMFGGSILYTLCGILFVLLLMILVEYIMWKKAK